MIETLLKFGFTKKEAAIYLASMELGIASAVSLIAKKAGRTLKACDTKDATLPGGATGRFAAFVERAKAAHTRTDGSVIRCGFAGRENVPGATAMLESTFSAVTTAVCEVLTMRAEKRGRAEPSPSDPRGGSYCMPPLALL